MSRYSKLFHSAKSTWSKNSQEPFDQSFASIPGYGYPPTTTTSPSHDSNFPMASSPPHPYTLAAIHSPVDTRSIEEREQTNNITSRLLRSENATTTASNASDTLNSPPSETRPVETEKPASGQHAYRPSNSRARNLHANGNGTSSQGPSVPPPLPIHLRPIVLFLIFLPIPPLLSLIYMATGHAILRSSNPAASIYRAAILTSVEAGATGGVILSIPLALLFYIFLYPNKPTTAPEDFFEDDTSSVVGTTRVMRQTGYAAALLLFLCIGGIAGPLGVTCLSNGSTTFVAQRKMLSPSSAAAAGFVGGAALALGLAALSALGMVSYGFYMRRNSSQRSNPSS